MLSPAYRYILYSFFNIIIEYFITDAYAAVTALLPPPQQQQQRIGRIYILYSIRNISPHSARPEPIGI